MKIIKHSDIVDLNISPLQYMEWVENALNEQYDSVIPAKTSIHLPNDGFFNTMPCYLPKHNAIGVKTVTRIKDNIPALDATIMIYDSKTVELKALMDATQITTMRTGAVAATSIMTLKNNKCVNELSIMGLGVTAGATVLCLLESMPDEHFNIKLLRYKDQAEHFKKRFENYNNASFTIVDTHEQLIIGADIIVSCITVANDLIGKDEWFKEGVLLVPVHTRGFQNCDMFFDKVFGDLTAQISGFNNFNKFQYFDEFAKVIQGTIPGRENPKERILVYNIGIALHDIYIADKIMALVDKNATINTVNIKETLPKFHI